MTPKQFYTAKSSHKRKGKFVKPHQMKFAPKSDYNLCKRKRAYATWRSAHQAAMCSEMRHGIFFRAFQCDVCQKYHITSDTNPKK